MNKLISTIKTSWPVWLAVAVVIGLWGAWHRGADSVEHRPCPPAKPAIVYVPAGPDVCREESDCGANWDGTRWVVVPGEVSE